MGKHTREFKLEVLRMMREGDRPTVEIARELGLKREMLYRWRDEYDQKLDKAFKGSGRPKSEEASEISRLRKENQELREERDILKKAAAYFAKDLK